MKDFNRKCASIVMDAHSHVWMKVFASIQLDVCYYVIGSFPRTTGPDTAYSRQVAIVHAPFWDLFPEQSKHMASQGGFTNGRAWLQAGLSRVRGLRHALQAA